MRKFGGVLLLILWLAATGLAADHTPPPVQPATAFPAVEIHPGEHVAIAVEPYDTKEKESIFRVDYLDHDVMPVRPSLPTWATSPSRCAMRAFSLRPRTATASRPPSPRTWNG